MKSSHAGCVNNLASLFSFPFLSSHSGCPTSLTSFVLFYFLSHVLVFMLEVFFSPRFHPDFSTHVYLYFLHISAHAKSMFTWTSPISCCSYLLCLCFVFHLFLLFPFDLSFFGPTLLVGMDLSYLHLHFCFALITACSTPSWMSYYSATPHTYCLAKFTFMENKLVQSNSTNFYNGNFLH